MHHLSSHNRHRFALYIAGPILASTAVGLRIFCKTRRIRGRGTSVGGTRIQADDYWAVAALVSALMACGFMMWGVIAGANVEEISRIEATLAKDPSKASQLSNYLKSLYYAILSIQFELYASKISLLLFYRSIFFITSTHQRLSSALIVLSTLLFIGSLFPTILRCIPVATSWNFQKPTTCVQFNHFLVVSGILDVAVDLAILVLPLGVVVRLKLPLHTRVGVAGIFGLGGFAVVTNVLRVVLTYQRGQHPNLARGELWLYVHMLVCIWCACLPTFKPLWSCASPAMDRCLAWCSVPFCGRVKRRKVAGEESMEDSWIRMV